MNPSDNPDDGDLRARFQSLREEETAITPSFRSMTAPLAETESPRLLPRLLVPLATAAAISLVVIPQLKKRVPVPPSLASNLPVLLPAGSETRSFLAGMEEERKARGYASDELLPFYFKIDL